MASSRPTQSMNVLSVQSSNPKGNQHPRKNKRKGKNNCKGGNKNYNDNNDKNTNNAGGDKKPNRKVKFPCKSCGDDHLTYLCPCMEDASKFIAHGPTYVYKSFTK